MEKLAPRVIIFAMGLFMVIVSIGIAITSPTPAPKQYLGNESTKPVNLTAAGSYPDDLTFTESVRAFFGADIQAERSAAHRAAELRKLQLRAKGHKTYNTRTKGVLYNGS